MRSIPFRAVNRYSPFFADYTDDYEKVGEFFAGNPWVDSSWTEQFARCDGRTYERDELTDILVHQNRTATRKKSITRQIEKIRDPRSLVVVTGQQAGIFWGPLYTVYKALTAVRVADYLEKKYSRPVVPLFWLEVDDHDFDEVRNFHMMLPDGRVERFAYSDGENGLPIPVRMRKIPPEFSVLLDKLDSEFGRSETGKRTLAAVRKIYRAGRTLDDVFIRFFRKYFPKEHIVFFNPGDPRVKRLAQPLFQEVIARKDAINDRIQQQTGLLTDKNYTPQAALRPNALHLFIAEESGRKRLALDSATESDSRKLARFIDEKAENLSPDVFLRPVVQDYLLPTAAYIGGPSEIGYLAQLKKVYDFLTIPMPLIIPRWSGTLVDRKTAKFLRKAGVEPEQILQSSPQELISRIVEKSTGGKFEFQFEQTYDQLKSRLNEIRTLGASLDTTLVTMVDKSEQKMKYQLDKIQGRFRNSLQAAHKIAAVRADRAVKTVIPDNNLQERTFSVLNYLIRYGKDFSKLLSRNITVETGKHHILEF